MSVSPNCQKQTKLVQIADQTDTKEKTRKKATANAFKHQESQDTHILNNPLNKYHRWDSLPPPQL